MKKQILILAMFTLTIMFAGTTKVFGQALNPGVTDPTSPTPQPITPLSCLATSEPLHPFAGVPYIYSLDGASGEETASSFTWWATKDVNFISGIVDVATMGNTNFGTALASPDVLNTSATYGVTTAAGAGANEVEITWGAGVLAGTDYQGLPGPGTPTFVVGYSEGTNCADNIQVYEINPLPNFTIDIAAINPDDDATLPWDDNTTADLCVDVVQSATYNTTTYELDMDYGTNTFYYEVAAANFVNDWTPTFTLLTNTGLDGLRTTQTAVLEMYPTLADAQGSTNMIASNAATPWDATTSTWATGTALSATTPEDATTGVSVFVKVVITNLTEESLTSNPFVLAVDAQDDGGAGIWDMEDEDCAGDPALDAPDQIDFATVTVLPRPQLDHNTVDGGAPIPTTTIPKPATTTGSGTGF